MEYNAPPPTDPPEANTAAGEGRAMQLVRSKAIRRRWKKISRNRDLHEDGSRINASLEGWFLHTPDGKTHGPFLYAHDARDFHANNPSAGTGLAR